jgi:hypothetical protein
MSTWIFTQKSEPVTLTAEERDAERGDFERAWERDNGTDWRTK